MYGNKDVFVKSARFKPDRPLPVDEPVVGSSPVVVPVAPETKRSVVLTSKVPPNGGYGWTVVISAFLVCFVYWGFLKSLDVFKGAIAAEFPKTAPTVTVWIFELTGTVSLITAPLAGISVKTCGFRITAFLGGVLCCLGLVVSHFVNSAGLVVCCIGSLVGVGASFAVTSSLACIGGYFTTLLPAALALALSGSSVGALVLPNGIKLVLEVLGLRDTFYVLAGLFAVVCLCSFAFAPPENHFLTVVTVGETVFESERVRGDDTQSCLCVRFAKALSDTLALRHLSKSTFLLMATSAFSMGMGYPHFHHYIPERAEALDLSRQNTAELLSYAVVLSDLASRLLYGFFATRWAFARSVEYTIAVVIAATAAAALPFCTEFFHFIIVSVLAGVGAGMWTVAVPVLLVANHGSQELGATFSLIRFFLGAANVVHAFSVKVLDYTLGAEAVLFYMGGSVGFAAVLSLFLNLAVFVRGRKKKRTSQI